MRRFFRSVEYPVLATEIVVYLTPIMQAELDALRALLVILLGR